MLITLLIIGGALLTGTVLMNEAKITRNGYALLAAGLVIGLTLITALTYILSFVLAIKLAAMAVTSVAAAISAMWLITHKSALANLEKLHWPFDTLAVTLAAILVTALLTPLVLSEKNGGIGTGLLSNYGDSAWHASITTTLVSGAQTIPPQNPSFAGQTLVYPFGSNVTTAIFLAGGASLLQAMNLLVMLLVPACFILLYTLNKKLTQSTTASVIALLLVIGGGSTAAWLTQSRAWYNDGASLLTILTNPPGYFSGSTEVVNLTHFLNPLITLLVPQRGLLIAVPLVIVITLTLFAAHNKKGDRQKISYAIAGIATGLLPLMHVHATLALAPIVCLLLWQNRRDPWMWFLVPTAVITAPLILYYTLNGAGGHLAWNPGWMKPDNVSLITYWLANFGLLIPLTAGVLFLKPSRELKILGISSLLIFAATQLWQFALWEWDNTKLLFFWLIYTAPTVSWLLVFSHRTPTKTIATASIIVLLLLHAISGTADITNILIRRPYYEIWSKEARVAARATAEYTQPTDVIATAPIHNSGLELVGRLRYLGYTGHVVSHGLIPSERETTLQNIFTGATTTEPLPDALLQGPAEAAAYPGTPDPNIWHPTQLTERWILYRRVP